MKTNVYNNVPSEQISLTLGFSAEHIQLIYILVIKNVLGLMIFSPFFCLLALAQDPNDNRVLDRLIGYCCI